MKEYKVNANFHINVETYVDAENEEEAKKQAIANILNKECDWLDPIESPSVNWVKEECEDDIEPCSVCFDTECNGQCMGDGLLGG